MNKLFKIAVKSVLAEQNFNLEKLISIQGMALCQSLVRFNKLVLELPYDGKRQLDDGYEKSFTSYELALPLVSSKLGEFGLSISFPKYKRESRDSKNHIGVIMRLSHELGGFMDVESRMLGIDDASQAYKAEQEEFKSIVFCKRELLFSTIFNVRCMNADDIYSGEFDDAVIAGSSVLAIESCFPDRDKLNKFTDSVVNKEYGFKSIELIHPASFNELLAKAKIQSTV
jgi:hypothetical protein